MENEETKLLLSNLAIKGEEDIHFQFEKIANQLFKHFQIVKNNAIPEKVIKYNFMELEFYYCSPNHPDIITYPRNAQAGDWFFHSSGVDICFQSNVEYNEETGRVIGKPIFDEQADEKQHTYGFGGILIRALRKIENGKTMYITGPLNCCYELFDQFSAFDDAPNFPRIETKDSVNGINCKSCGRYFNFSTNLETKLKNILHEHWEVEYETLEDKNKAIQVFEEYLKQSFCFFDQEAFDDYKKYKDDKKNNKSYKVYHAVPSKDKERLKIKQ